jgi:hypothetical protein
MEVAPCGINHSCKKFCVTGPRQTDRQIDIDGQKDSTPLLSKGKLIVLSSNIRPGWKKLACKLDIFYSASLDFPRVGLSSWNKI